MPTSLVYSSLRLLTRAALFTVASGLAPLPAQNTSPLDTAPGGGTADPVTNAPAATPTQAITPGQVPTPSTTPAPAAPSTPASTTADEGPSLLSNPKFDLATKKPDWPDDWGKGGGMSWETENGTHFLRMVQTTPEKMSMEYREMTLPEGVKGLKFTIRYRTAGVVPGVQKYMDARALFHFLDASRKKVGADPHTIKFSSKAANWTEATSTCLVPPEAKTLVVMPSFLMAKAGTLDLAELRINALTDDATTALTATVAAKTKTSSDEATTVAEDLKMPPITPEIKVVGNKLMTTDGKEVWLQGVNVPELAWSPNGEGKVQWSVHVATTDWHANIIRLPVMDGLWFGTGHSNEGPNDPVLYRKTVDEAIAIASAHGAYVLLDLHRFLTPDQTCIDFWKDAAARYKNNPAVLFDVFNEPHGTSWDVWQKGGPVDMKQKDGTTKTVQGVGMQALIDTIRGTGANNVVVAGGLEYAYDLTGVMNGFALDSKGGNGLMYATHFYNWHKGWSAHFMAVAAKYPVIIGETGADVGKMSFIPAKDQEDPSTWVPDMIGFVQKNHLNWTAWCFHTGANPALLLNTDACTPNTWWGEPVKEALGGKQFTMQKER